MALTLRKPPRKPAGSRGRKIVGLDIEPGRVVAAEVTVNGSVRRADRRRRASDRLRRATDADGFGGARLRADRDRRNPQRTASALLVAARMAMELAERGTLTLEHARMWLRHVGFDRHLDDIDGDSEIIAGARTVLTDGTRRLASEVRGRSSFTRPRPYPAPTSSTRCSPARRWRCPASPRRSRASSACRVETRSVSAGTDVAKESDLPGMTIAAGLGVERVSA